MGEAQLCGEMGLISKQTRSRQSGGHVDGGQSDAESVDKVATETDRQSHIWKDKQWMNKEGKAERMEGQVDNQPGWWDTAGGPVAGTPDEVPLLGAGHPLQRCDVIVAAPRRESEHAHLFGA